MNRNVHAENVTLVLDRCGELGRGDGQVETSSGVPLRSTILSAGFSGILGFF